MNKLKWWFRIVGGFYMLLAIMNMYAVFVDSSLISSGIPFPLDDNGVRVAVDMWSAFAFAILGISTFLLWASRNPLKYLGAVWLVVWLEIWYGIADDVFLIARGYDVVSYIVFIVIHLIIIVTGVMFARQAQAE